MVALKETMASGIAAYTMSPSAYPRVYLLELQWFLVILGFAWLPAIRRNQLPGDSGCCESFSDWNIFARWCVFSVTVF
jgi:hypothetical protein